ncbi:MAG: PEGA domain-containing protein [Myxococcales bacterium]|nr:PEGA domain-containing protein [Myxococcales bacterium]
MRPNAPAARAPSRIFGRFHFQEILEGPEPFVTYRARTQGLAGLERAFALKTLPVAAVRARPDAARRLLDVASRTAALREARIGQVVDFGMAPEGTVYVATEFLSGVNLSALREGLCREPEVRAVAARVLAHVGAEVAAALAAGHQASPPLVHGGLTPSNVFLTLRGAVKVVDFGQRLAVLSSEDPGPRPSAGPHAAPELVSPEQGSPAADVFALGVLVVELGTGTRPSVSRDVRSGSELSRSLLKLPGELAVPLAGLLRVDPAQRPSAREAERQLRRIATGMADTEVRALLAALARRLSAPPPGTPSESAVLPALEGGAGAVPRAPNAAAQTTEMAPCPADVALSAGDLRAVALDPGRTEASAMFELSVEDLVEALPEGASQAVTSAPRSVALRPKPPPVPTAGAVPPPGRPNMDNLTTGELEAMFAPGLAPGAGPAGQANAMVDPAAPPPENDFSEDAKTNAFEGRKLRPLLGDSFERPRRLSSTAGDVFPPLPEAQNVGAALPWDLDAPGVSGAFLPGLAEPTVEMDARQLLRSELLTGDPLPEDPAGAPADLAPAYSADAGEPEEGADALDSSNEAWEHELVTAQVRSTGRLRLIVTLATAACVALVTGVAGGYLLGERKAPPRASGDAVGPQAFPSPPALPPPAQAPAPPPVARPLPAPLAAAEPAVAPPAPRDAQGRVRVELSSAPPGAVVWINGGERGVTPTTVELKERHKRLLLVLPGHLPVEETLDHATLPATRSWTLVPATLPEPGSAAVSVTCQALGKYPISVDGKETGLLCPADIALAPGAHEVSVFVPWRFKRYVTRIDLLEGQRKKITLSR